MKVRPYTLPELRRLSADWKAGKPIAVIACDHGRTVGDLYDVMGRYRAMFPRRKNPGRHKRFDRQSARSLREQGLSFNAIGARLGVTGVAIYKALRATT